jgi:hypothetical protein
MPAAGPQPVASNINASTTAHEPSRIAIARGSELVARQGRISNSVERFNNRKASICYSLTARVVQTAADRRVS